MGHVQTKRGNIIAWIVILLVFVCGIWLLFSRDGATPIDESSTWKEYRNTKYGFEMKYPPGWEVTEKSDNISGPWFTIFDASETPKVNPPPYDHFTNQSHVSLYPNGIPTEGVIGTSATSSVEFPISLNQARDYLLENGSAFATFASPKSAPASWGPAGFIWMRVRVPDLREACERGGKEISIEFCDPLGGEDEIVRYGSVDEDIYEIEKQIIATLRFFETAVPNPGENIHVDIPETGSVVTSPLIVEGTARGSWFFEGIFSVAIVDQYGKVLGQASAEAFDDWRTNEFVSFRSEISFSAAPQTNLRLVLSKMNPSGLPENSEQKVIPLVAQ